MAEVTDRIWAHVKSEAASWTRHGRVPMDGDARDAIIAILALECVTLPPSAIDFYAREFAAMVKAAKPEQPH